MRAAGAVAQAEVLGAPRPFLRCALRPRSGSPYASSNCALGALRGTGGSGIRRSSDVLRPLPGAR